MIRAVALVLLFVLARPAVADLVDGVAGVVEDEVILLSEVEAAAAPVIAKMERQHGELPPATYREIRVQALQALIDGRLIATAAERLQLEASDEEIDEAITGIASQEGLSIDEIYAAVAAEGMEREVYRARLREEITRMKVISTAVRSRVSVKEKEIEKLFEERYRACTGCSVPDPE